MSINKFTIPFVCLVIALQGCGFMPDKNLAKQCIVAVGDGEFRYGSFTQYVKGEGSVIKIGEKGNGCTGKEVIVEKDGVIVTVE